MRRHTLRRALAVLACGAGLLAASPSATAADDGARAWIDRMLDALGGRQAISALRSLGVEADCEGPGGAFRTRVESWRPGSVYFRQTADDGSTEIWSTPEHTWRSTADGGHEVLPPEVRDFVRAHEFHLLLLEIESRFSDFEVGGTVSGLGAPCRRLSMRDGSGLPAAICIDEAGGLPLRLELNPEGAAGPLRIDFGHWREIEGIRYFHSFVLEEGPERKFSYHYREIAPNSVAADRFVPPATDERSDLGRRMPSRESSLLLPAR